MAAFATRLESVATAEKYLAALNPTKVSALATASEKLPQKRSFSTFTDNEDAQPREGEVRNADIFYNPFSHPDGDIGSDDDYRTDLKY